MQPHQSPLEELAAFSIAFIFGVAVGISLKIHTTRQQKRGDSCAMNN